MKNQSQTRLLWFPLSILSAVACEPVPTDPALAQPAGELLVSEASELYCPLAADPTYRPRSSTDVRVKNGEVYDCGALRYSSLQKLRVPEEMTIVRTTDADHFSVHLTKALLYQGHPIEPLSRDQARQKMGCAYRAEGNTLILATFGEWLTNEGGAIMRFTVSVPAGLEVETSPGLAGPDSAAQDRTSIPQFPRNNWFGSGRPAAGWASIATRSENISGPHPPVE